MLWYETGNGWAKTTFAKKDMNGDAYLVCPGPSLAQVDTDKLRGRGRTIFGINTAYPAVRPDVWMGLDEVDCYDRGIWAEPFVKICRGTYAEMKLADKPVKKFDNVYFATMKPPEPGKSMLDYRQHDDPLMWHKNTMAAMLHLIIWMGGKRIYLVGCDMGGSQDYHDDRKLTEGQRKYNRQLYQNQIGFIRELAKLAKPHGIEFISATPKSPLNDFLSYVPLTDALRKSEEAVGVKPEKVRHVLDSAKKIAVVTPTRGDRPQLLTAWRMMMKYQSVRPDKVYLIDREPTTEGNDQRERVAEGVEMAKKDGMTHIIIMEDDDYYPPDYIEKVIGAWDDENIVGGYYYSIYHIPHRNRVVYNMDMNGIEAPPLNSTAFTVKLWDSFLESGYMNTKQNLDLELWKWAREIRTKARYIHDPDLMISIKHGIGKVAGGNHAGIKEGYAVGDSKMKWLSNAVHPEIMKIYKRI